MSILAGYALASRFEQDRVGSSPALPRDRARLFESFLAVFRGRYSAVDCVVGALADVIRHVECEVIQQARVESEIEHSLHFVICYAKPAGPQSPSNS